jgi:putative protease
MEVLAPAGSKDALKAALEGGADAVYLGGKLFGARRFATNFSDAELKCAVQLAHQKGSKIYVTVNTLIKDRELPLAYGYLDFLNHIGVDAVIVQDRGLARLIKENFSIPVHASTQMGLHSPEDAQWAESIGLDRIILARELSLEEVKKIIDSSSIGIEVFIHGALCYCFSGQCLFSSILGGRSGNRGMCAQPCRKRYSLGKDTNYMLSTADLFSIDAIPQLLSMGVDSVKIEGRLRSPVYVFLASKIYKNAVERASRGEEVLITPRERELLSVAFNRGFSGGYLTTMEVMQRRFPESRGLPLGKIVSYGKTVRVPGLLLEEGDGITFYRGEDKIGGFEVKNPARDNGSTVLTSPFRLETGEYEAYKTKDREFPEIEKRIAALPFPTCQVNHRPKSFELPEVRRRGRKGELSFYVSSIPALKAVLPYAQRIYIEAGPHVEEVAEDCRSSKVECVQMLPRIAPTLPAVADGAIMVHSPGQAVRYNGKRLFGSYFMNFFNFLNVPDLYQYTMSVELSREDISELTTHYSGRLEAMVFGRIELMVTRDPSLQEGTLIDERGKRFPVVRDHTGYAHILNSSDLFLLDFLDELDAMGIDSYGIDLRNRPPDLCGIVAKAFAQRDLRAKDKIKRKVGGITAGHYLRGVL